MKILSVRLKNLNALKGEWKIDFTQAPFDDSSLFAIVGATGAGKTTLLDAICLALYHETPRLQVSGSDNQLMTHHTQECLAEVEFAVNDTVYRAFWSQRRAARTQRLQQPVVELARADGEILASRQGDKKQQIEALTGLDFNRFTKSMLLSQGQFAAFLNADDKERAGLLEKLTGTEIYGQISEQVYQRYREEQDAVSQLEYKLEGTELLTSDAVALYRQEIEDTQRLLDQRSAEYQDQQALLSAVNQLEQLWHKQQQADEQLKTAKEAFKTHKASLRSLEQAVPARELLPDFQRLQDRQVQLRESRDALALLEQQRQDQSERLQQAQQHFNTADTALKADRVHKTEAEQRLNEVLAPLDENIRHYARQLTEQTQQHDAEQARLETIKGQLQQAEVRCQQLSAEQQKGLEWLQAHQPLSALNEALPQIREGMRRRAELADEQNTQQGLLQECVRSLSALEQKTAPLEAQLTDLEQQRKRAQTALEPLQRQLDEHPLPGEQNGRPLLSQLHTLSEPVQQLVYLQQSLSQLQHAIQQQRVEIERQTSAVPPLDAERKALRQRYREQNEHLQDLEKLLQREQQITALKDARQQLQPQEPCPLCGSQDHPAIDAYQAIELSQTEQRVQALRGQLEQIRQQGENLRNRIDQHQARLETLQQDQQQKQQQLQQTESAWQETCGSVQGILRQLADDLDQMPLLRADAKSTAQASLINFIDQYRQMPGLSEVAEDFAESLQQTLHQVSRQWQQLVEEKERLQQDFWQRQQVVQQQDQQRQNLQVQQSQHHRQISQLTERREQLTAGLERLNQQQTQVEQSLSGLLTSSGRVLPEPEAQSDFLQTLEADLHQWQRTLEHQQQTEQALKEERLRQDNLLQQKQQQQARCSELQDALQQIRRQHRTLEEERHLSFGSATLEEERARLYRQLEQSEQQLEKQRQCLAEERERAEALKAQHQQQQAFTKQAENQLTEAEQRWQQVLADSCFRNQKAFEKALPDPKTFAEWQTLKQALDEALHAADVTLEVTTQNLQQFVKQDSALQKQMAESDADSGMPSAPQIRKWLRQQPERAEKLERLQQEREALQTTLTERRQQLRLDDERRQGLKTLSEQLDQQRETADLWAQMNHLIGSAKGDKFRRFAQGLTLEYLVELANRQLLQLHDRYRLRRQANEALSIEILDTWQADAVRDTRTLSGGESFLVSLALALALSDLVSHKVRIDSLFLDEGFGTLDSETLEMALNALDNLNASGKMIGVISHISAMKERIPVQIKVHKKQGLGISELDARYYVGPA